MDSIRLVLQTRFDAIRARNPSYSLRAYAKKLDVHPAALCEILQGKRNVSTKLAARLAAGLALGEAERERVLALAAGGKGLKALDKKHRAETSQLALDQYFVVSEWHYYAILSLAETRGFRATPALIAKRLGIPRELAASALARLTRLGYFTRVKGRLVLKPKFSLATSDDIASAALRRRHAANLEAASQALETVPVELREMTFITMAIDPAKLPVAKTLVREFRDKLCAFLEDGTKSEVYEFCLSLFPRTIVVLALFFIAACTKPVTNAAPSAPPTPPSIEDGHSGGNGGDLVKAEEGAAWFLGKGKKIDACLEISDDFGWKPEDLRREVEATLGVWTEYIEKKRIYFAVGDKYVRPEFPSEIHWLEKCGAEHLKFYFGASDDRVARDRRRAPERLAYAMPLAYDMKKRWGSGYIWFAAPRSIEPAIGFPDWHVPDTLHAMLLHEWGHVLGCGHVPGTIMDAKIAETMRAIRGDDQSGVPYFVLHKIDQLRELYFCSFCTTEYLGSLPDYEMFKALYGRERSDPGTATFTLGHEPSDGEQVEVRGTFTMKDAVGEVSLPVRLFPETVRRVPSVLPIFKLYANGKVFQANGGEGWLYSAKLGENRVQIQINIGFDERVWGPEQFDFYKWTMPFQIQSDADAPFLGRTLFRAFPR